LDGPAWEVVGNAGFSAFAATYTSIVNTGSEMVVAYEGGGAFAKTLPVTTLPVKLTAFNVISKNQKHVNINWQTASENNNNYFTTLKSQDGKTFEQLTTVKSKGNNGGDYQTIDFAPFEGTSYYKLSQTDTDGKTKDLGIRTLKMES